MFSTIKMEEFYEVGSSRWCGACDEITPTEFNPEWITAGKPNNNLGDFSWISKCSVCEDLHPVDREEWGDCPHCGMFFDELQIVEIKEKGNFLTDCGTQYYWTEVRKCPSCQQLSEFRQST